MFCENCGAENENSAKFCRSCGKPLGSQANAQTGNADQSQAAPTGAQVNGGQLLEKVKALPKKVLLGGIVAIVVLVLLIAVGVNASNTINLDKYVTVETTGYDGFGHAQATIDWDAIEEKYGDKIKFNSAAKKEYGDFLNILTPVEALREGVSIDLDKKTQLSNGDEITYTWDIDEDINKYVKCKLKYKDKTIKVSDLEKVDTFDAFGNLEVTFDGVGPAGTVNLNYTGSELTTYDFTCDNTTGLSNGDKVEIHIEDSVIEGLAQSIGKIPAEASKEYTVEGLQSYLQKISELNSETLDAMKSQADDAYRALVAQNWDDDEKLDSFEYIGSYLLTAKSDDSWGSKNKLFLVFKATVDNEFKSYHQKNYVYWYMEYDNVVIDEDGKSDMDITRYSTSYNSFTVDSGVSDGWFGTHSWYYNGYATVNDLYKEVVTANAESYNHEDNVEDTESATVTEDTEAADTEAAETEEAE